MAEESHESETEGTSVGDAYTALMDQVEAVLQMLETAETALHALQRPIELIALDQLGEVPFLLTSPFRQQSFSLKRIPSERIPFHAICANLRAHCIPLTDQNGTIRVSPFLREQLHVSTDTVQFPQLLGALTHGVV
jgi:hypothetical protein